jgi:hypothetical protein
MSAIVEAPCKLCGLPTLDIGPVDENWFCDLCRFGGKAMKAELATLRDQLADAVKVVEAARSALPFVSRIGAWDDLSKSIDNYDAKHGRK